MTVEASLTRELGIAFIDARKLTTEAKIQLGMTGYPNAEQKLQLMNAAIKIFEERPEKVQERMRGLKAGLDMVGSLHSAFSIDSTSTTDVDEVSESFSQSTGNPVDATDDLPSPVKPKSLRLFMTTSSKDKKTKETEEEKKERKEAKKERKEAKKERKEEQKLLKKEKKKELPRRTAYKQQLEL